jgi:hypothetical protein
MLGFDRQVFPKRLASPYGTRRGRGEIDAALTEVGVRGKIN